MRELVIEVIPSLPIRPDVIAAEVRDQLAEWRARDIAYGDAYAECVEAAQQLYPTADIQDVHVAALRAADAIWQSRGDQSKS